MVKPIEQFADDVWADLPTQDENGVRIYRGPIVDLLVFDLIVTLFKTLLTNGGCLNPNFCSGVSCRSSTIAET